jgi:Bacterial regulatory proteins, luxR family
VTSAETCRQALGDERFESYRQRGLELSVAEAIAVARNEVPVPADEISTDRLTRREREIAGLVTQGLGNREIAEQLVLAKRTVDRQLTSSPALACSPCCQDSTYCTRFRSQLSSWQRPRIACGGSALPTVIGSLGQPQLASRPPESQRSRNTHLAHSYLFRLTRC